jgi:hypothetical protein
VTDTNVFQLSQPGTFADPLTEVLRNGARALLAQAVEAEVAALLSGHADEMTEDGRQRLVRHGHLPEREIMTGQANASSTPAISPACHRGQTWGALTTSMMPKSKNLDRARSSLGRHSPRTVIGSGSSVRRVSSISAGRWNWARIVGTRAAGDAGGTGSLTAKTVLAAQPKERRSGSGGGRGL